MDRFAVLMHTHFHAAYQGGIIDKTHYFAVRVYFEDTDAGGVVYHANYLRYLERARSDLLRTLGIDQRAAMLQGEGVYAVSEVQIKYWKPAVLEEELVVATTLRQMRRASCLLAQTITRRGEVITEATVLAAFVSPEGRPKRQPPEWVEKFAALGATNPE